MSFEGHYQLLCRSGHEDSADWTEFAYYDGDDALKEWRCEDCGKSLAWWNLVDDTNCDGEEIELEMVTPTIYTKNGVGILEEATFVIPSDKGHQYP